MNLRASLQGCALAAVLAVVTLLNTGCCGPGMIQHACPGIGCGPASIGCAAPACGCESGACGVAEDCGCAGGCTGGCASSWSGGGWGRCTGVNWNPHGLFRHGPFVTLHHMLGGVGACEPFCGGGVGCTDDACGAACGGACGCGGCGETYVGEWISDPPYPTDPCCDLGSCGGNRCCGGWLVNGWKTLWGCRYGGVGGCADVGCAGGSCGCGEGSCGTAQYDGLSEVPADIHGTTIQPQIIEGPSVIHESPSLAPPAGNTPKAGGKNPFVPDAKAPAGGSMTRSQPRRSYPGYRAARAGYRTSPR